MGSNQPKYKRVILKISGEALAGAGHTGLDDAMLASVAKDVKQLRELGVEVAIVVGGGNFWRGRTSGDMDRATADYMGMLATCINALALQDAFERQGVPTRVQTAIEMREIAEPYIRRRALSELENGWVVIFAAGIGSPFFSTDTTAALRAAEMDAEVILLAKKQRPGEESQCKTIYEADPSAGAGGQSAGDGFHRSQPLQRQQDPYPRVRPCRRKRHFPGSHGRRDRYDHRIGGNHEHYNRQL